MGNTQKQMEIYTVFTYTETSKYSGTFDILSIDTERKERENVVDYFIKNTMSFRIWLTYDLSE